MPNILKLITKDHDIIEGIRNGDESVLLNLYRKNIRMITHFVTSRNGSISDATEILQEAIIVLWENVRKDRFVLKSKISTYLFGVAKNKWLQELERRKRLQNIDRVQTQDSGQQSAEQILIEQEMAEIVKSCMVKLSSLCRQILTLYYYEDKPMLEISKLTGLANENVAKSKKYQCKKELEQLVKAALKEGGQA
jgi:RNA polymerase sigma factor (sigma-70 family)